MLNINEQAYALILQGLSQADTLATLAISGDDPNQARKVALDFARTLNVLKRNHGLNLPSVHRPR